MQHSLAFSWRGSLMNTLIEFTILSQARPAPLSTLIDYYTVHISSPRDLTHRNCLFARLYYHRVVLIRWDVLVSSLFEDAVMLTNSGNVIRQEVDILVVQRQQ